MITLTSPVTGAAQTGLTSPTYTHVADSASGNSKQYAVTALGGTQPSVYVHAVDNPFTITFFRPSKFKTLLDGEGARNNYSVLVRKGVQVDSLVGGKRKVAIVRIGIEVPVGAESVDPSSIRAMLSLAIGALSQVSSGQGDTIITGIM